MKPSLTALLCLIISLLNSPVFSGTQNVAVGSKSFTESVVLGEIASHLARSADGIVTHRRAMGGTRVLWNALQNGDISIYPEYTGTITQEILSEQQLGDLASIQIALAAHGARMTRPLGFNNTYAIGMMETHAAALGIHTISDLRSHPDLRFGFSNEFMDRGDGWPSLRNTYALPQQRVN